LEAIETLIVGFARQVIIQLEPRDCPFKSGKKISSQTIKENFLLVVIPMAYNVIRARPTLITIKAVVTPYVTHTL